MIPTMLPSTAQTPVMACSLVGVFVVVGVSVGVLVGTFVGVGVSLGVLTGVFVGVGVVIGVGVSVGHQQVGDPQDGRSTPDSCCLSMAAEAPRGELISSAALAMKKPTTPKSARKPSNEMTRFTLMSLLTLPHKQKSRRLQRLTSGEKAAAEDSPRMLSSAARLS